MKQRPRRAARLACRIGSGSWVNAACGCNQGGESPRRPDQIAMDRFVGPKLGEVGGCITEKEVQLEQDLIETYHDLKDVG